MLSLALIAGSLRVIGEKCYFENDLFGASSFDWTFHFSLRNSFYLVFMFKHHFTFLHWIGDPSIVICRGIV